MIVMYKSMVGFYHCMMSYMISHHGCCALWCTRHIDHDVANIQVERKGLDVMNIPASS